MVEMLYKAKPLYGFPTKIASSVGYDGVKMRVYIWMEGTDADCINNVAA